MEKLIINEFDEMVKSAEKKGFSVWTGKGQYTDYTGWLGIETKSFQVYWFKIGENGKLHFSHAHSCNTGRTTKGFTQGFNFMWKMFLKDISEKQNETK